MLTPVERVLVLRGADLLKDVGPRHLLGLAEVAREVEMASGDAIYGEEDAADAMYMVVRGRVRLEAAGRTISEVGPGEAFGSWALVDDSARGQSATCVEDGLALALNRDEFYDVAAGDLELLKEVVAALARRLRALVSERPEEARVEGEGVEKPAAMAEAETIAAAEPGASETAPATPGAALEAAVLGQPAPETNAPGPEPEPELPSTPPGPP